MNFFISKTTIEDITKLDDLMNFFDLQEYPDLDNLIFKKLKLNPKDFLPSYLSKYDYLDDNVKSALLKAKLSELQGFYDEEKIKIESLSSSKLESLSDVENIFQTFFKIFEKFKDFKNIDILYIDLKEKKCEELTKYVDLDTFDLLSKASDFFEETVELIDPLILNDYLTKEKENESLKMLDVRIKEFASLKKASIDLDLIEQYNKRLLLNSSEFVKIKEVKTFIRSNGIKLSLDSIEESLKNSSQEEIFYLLSKRFSKSFFLFKKSLANHLVCYIKESTELIHDLGYNDLYSEYASEYTLPLNSLFEIKGIIRSNLSLITNEYTLFKISKEKINSNEINIWNYFIDSSRELNFKDLDASSTSFNGSLYNYKNTLKLYGDELLNRSKPVYDKLSEFFSNSKIDNVTFIDFIREFEKEYFRLQLVDNFHNFLTYDESYSSFSSYVWGYTHVLVYLITCFSNATTNKLKDYYSSKLIELYYKNIFKVTISADFIIRLSSNLDKIQSCIFSKDKVNTVNNFYLQTLKNYFPSAIFGNNIEKGWSINTCIVSAFENPLNVLEFSIASVLAFKLTTPNDNNFSIKDNFYQTMKKASTTNPLEFYSSLTKINSVFDFVTEAINKFKFFLRFNNDLR